MLSNMLNDLAEAMKALDGKKTMGYPWLTTTQSGYLCCKHAGSKMGREAVGGGYNTLFQTFFVCLFVLFYLFCCMVV